MKYELELHSLALFSIIFSLVIFAPQQVYSLENGDISADDRINLENRVDRLLETGVFSNQNEEFNTGSETKRRKGRKPGKPKKGKTKEKGREKRD